MSGGYGEQALLEGATTTPRGDKNMAASLRWIGLALFAFGAAQPAFSQSISPLPERMAQLPDADFHAWFNTMLGMEYREGADWQAFFGDVGPAEGCGALQEIKNRILARDLAEFRAAYVDAVSKGMAPTALSDVPDTHLTMAFNSRIDRFKKSLGSFLGLRALEMGKSAREWADSHGYRGRRLGYNRAGTPYWGSQPAMTTLVCLFPADAGLLKGWED